MAKFILIDGVIFLILVAAVTVSITSFVRYLKNNKTKKGKK